MLKTDSVTTSFLARFADAQDTANYKYTYEPGKQDWSPLNSNMQMHGIKVGTEILTRFHSDVAGEGA
jgi:hypothetical protein